MADKKRKALGRGLSALLGDAKGDYADSSAGAAPESAPEMKSESESASGAARGVRTVPVEKLTSGAMQPRTVFDEDSLKGLAGSIKANGVLTPLIVRTNPDPETGAEYEIIAGERRWRAAQTAQLHEVPVIIRDDLTPPNLFEIALVDNLQRENLNDIEEAAAYDRLISEFGYTQKAVAEAVGKSREYVANTVRLLKLPRPVLDMIETGVLSAGHGRALLAVPASRTDLIIGVARQVAEEKMSVRQLEDALRVDRPYKPRAGGYTGRAGRPGSPGSPGGAHSSRSGGVNPDARAIEKQLRESLGLRVGVRMRKGSRGDVIITFESLEQFDSLLETLSRGLAKRR